MSPLTRNLRLIHRAVRDDLSGPRSTRPKSKARLRVEALEQRALMADDFPNTFDGAAGIGLDTLGSGHREGTIEVAGDQDMFRFTAPLTGRSLIRVEAQVGSKLDPVVAAYDSKKKLLFTNNDATTTTTNSRVDVAVKPGDTIFILASGIPKSTGGYTVRVVTRPLDPSLTSPIDDYPNHLGADYEAEAGTPLLSPISGKVANVSYSASEDSYGTMLLAIDVTLPKKRTFQSEFSGVTLTTDKIRVIFGHLRPSNEVVVDDTRSGRFNKGKGELTYRVGDQVVAGQLLGYIEIKPYSGHSSNPHVHIGASDLNSPPPNPYKGFGVLPTDQVRKKFIRPELSWALLR